MEASQSSRVSLRRRSSAKRAAVPLAGHVGSSDDPLMGGSDGEANRPASPSVAAGARIGRGKVAVKQTYGKRSKAAATSTTRARSSSMKEHGTTEPRPTATTRKERSPSFPAFNPISKLGASILKSGVEAKIEVARPPRPKPVSKKMKMAPPTVKKPVTLDDELSDLTSLTASTSSRSSPDVEFIKEALPFPKPRDVSVTLTSRLGLTHETKESTWTAKSLGIYVWVLVEPHSAQVFDPEESNDTTEWLWWPGKIDGPQSVDTTLKVQLFKFNQKAVAVKTPCESNIMPKLNSLNQWRFTAPTFVSSPLQDGLASPQKRIKRSKMDKLDRDDTERRWREAIAEMMEDEELDDNLPEVGEMFTVPVASSSLSTISAPPILLITDTKVDSKGRKGKRKRDTISDDSMDEDYRTVPQETEDVWEPPPPDDTLEIPGELVFGRDKPSATAEYWPARIEHYIPPSTRKQQPKYHVTWLDNSTQDILRSWFYSSDEEGFVTCKLGLFKSVVLEVQNDEDDKNHETFLDSIRRLPSPAPLDPLPDVEDFNELSIREQFVYTKEVLKAILNNDYKPTKEKHQLFMKGGKSRQSLMVGAGMRGKMDPKHVEHLMCLVNEWCLRDSGPKAAHIDEDVGLMGDLDGNEVKVVENVGVELRAPPAPTSEIGDVITVEPDATHCQSPPNTVAMASSPPEMPPSSCPSSGLETEEYFPSQDSVIPLTPSLSMASIRSVTPSLSISEPPATNDTDIGDTSDDAKLDEDQTISMNGRPPRQFGCNDFESLTRLVKVDYCTMVLGPECVRQVLLWRDGARRSVELLSLHAEQALHDRGEELVRETDWVNDLMRWRDAAKRGRDKEAELRNLGTSKNGGISRRRRNAAPVNYQE